ncbi:MAG: hypothetical protein U0169_16855 [Polyangiaceae bacterium]
MSTAPETPITRLSPRLRRTLQLAYGVEGVTGARIWQWADTVAVGVSVAPSSNAGTTLRRVESALAGVREPGEAWEFGLLDAS